ncbi:MAG: TRAM domain-containing protein [Candidatus Woesearchaeota archaeon]
MERNNFEKNVAPVKVGDELDVKIEAVGEKGDGLVKVKGFVLFVSGVKEGDEVRIRITRVLSKVGFAEVASRNAKKSTEKESESAESTEEATEESTEEYEEAEDSEDFGEE